MPSRREEQRRYDSMRSSLRLTDTTACSWDTIIPFDSMWEAFKRVIKPKGAIVLTASQPFTSALVMSNPSWFRCEWVIRKPKGTGYLNAKRQPMKNHEVAIVFSKGEHHYYPQMRKGIPYMATSGAAGGFIRDKSVAGHTTVNDGDRYPLSVIESAWNTTKSHPTEKPIDVFEYFICSYTQPGDLVLDPTCGSGTTAVAARNTKRQFIAGDTSLDYVLVARDRLRLPFEARQTQVINDLSGLPMFADLETT